MKLRSFEFAPEWWGRKNIDLGCVREAVDGALLSFNYLRVLHERVTNLADGVETCVPPSCTWRQSQIEWLPLAMR